MDMPMTLLVDRLTVDLHQKMDPSLDHAWKQEIRRRVAEIESGKVQGVPGDEVSARIRMILSGFRGKAF